MIEKYCKYCGKPLVRKVNADGSREADSQIIRRTYCDKECMKKAFSGHKKETDLSWYAAHQHAREIVEKEKCEICGSTKNLDVHHKDGNEQNNSRENLQVLCRSCHIKAHRTRNVCSVNGCENISKGHGYCNKHLLRYRKYGDPLLTNRGHGHIVKAKD